MTDIYDWWLNAQHRRYDNMVWLWTNHPVFATSVAIVGITLIVISRK